jgi:MIP family channel proteins
MNLGVEELTSPEALKAALAELIGTALFVMIGVGAIVAVISSGGTDAVSSIALAHGFAYAFLVAGIAGISGGHINPAVTFAMTITGRITLIRGGMYIVAQLIGACIGVLLLRAFVVDEILEAIPGGGGNALSPAVSEVWHGMLLEALGTFVLVWTIFAVAVNPRTGSGNVAPLYIGLAVGVVHLFLVPLTGSGINPARTFGPALFLPDSGATDPGRWADAWIYYIGPLLGAAAASLTYFMLYLMPGRNSG